MGQTEFGWSIDLNNDSSYSAVSGAENNQFHLGIVYWKFSLDGNVLLQNEFFKPDRDIYPGLSHTMKKLSDGNFFVAGGVNEYDPLNQNVVVLKVKENGDQLFFKSIETGNYDAAYNSTILGDNGFAVTGFTYPDTGILTNLLLMKVDSSGNLVWSKSYGGTEADNGYTVNEISGKRLFVSGNKNYSITNYAPWVMITDSSGNILKEKEWTSGAIYCGATSTYLTLDSMYLMKGCMDTVVNPGDYHYAAFIGKMDTSFNFKWQAVYNGSDEYYIYIAKQMQDSSIVFVGAVIDTLSIFSTGWVGKVDAHGNKLWEHAYKYGNSTFNYLSDFQQTADKGYIITGSTIGPTSQDVWLLKLDSVGCLNPNNCYTGDLTVEISKDAELRIAPNPASDVANIVYNLPEKNTAAQFIISDLTGREILRLNTDAYLNTTALDVRHWHDGVYVCTLLSQEQLILSRKFVVMH